MLAHRVPAGSRPAQWGSPGPAPMAVAGATTHQNRAFDPTKNGDFMGIHGYYTSNDET